MPINRALQLHLYDTLLLLGRAPLSVVGNDVFRREVRGSLIDDVASCGNTSALTVAHWLLLLFRACSGSGLIPNLCTGHLFTTLTPLVVVEVVERRGEESIDSWREAMYTQQHC